MRKNFKVKLQARWTLQLTELIVQMLKQGARNHQINKRIPKANGVPHEWRRLDLRGIELVNTDLSGVDFRNINFSYSNFYNCNLMKSKFDSVLLNESVILDTKLQQSKFSGVNFSKSKIANTDFSGSIIVNCNFSNSDLVSSRFIMSVLHFCSFSEATFNDTMMGGAVIQGVDFGHASLLSTKLTGAYIGSLGTCNWKIDKTQCDYLYYLTKTINIEHISDSTKYEFSECALEKIPAYRSFDEGEFDKIYAHLNDMLYTFENHDKAKNKHLAIELFNQMLKEIESGR